MRRLGAIVLMVCALLFARGSRAFASTAVPSTITADTVWTTADSPYVITGTVTVNAGVTLTVEPGVVAKFGPTGRLHVNGSLNASGTSVDTIVFTSIKDDSYGGDTNGDGSTTTPVAGDWYCIDSPSGGSVSLDYALMRYGGAAYPVLYGYGGTITVSNSTVEKSRGRGIQLQGDTSLVSGTTIREFGPTGVYVYSGNPTIQNSTITGGSYGVYVNGGAPTISGNTVSDATTVGVQYNVGSGASAGGTLTGNTITGGGGYAVDFLLSSGGIGSMTIGQNSFTGKPFNGYGISGTLGVSTSLPSLDNPYVFHSLTVNALKSLSLAPGTVAKFATNSSLTVKGNFDARGTPSSNIVFTSIKDDTYGGDTNGDGTATSPAPGNWYDIGTSSGGTVTLDSVLVRYGGGTYPMLYGLGGTLGISNSTVEQSASKGIHLEGDASTVSGTTIRDFGSSSTGVYVASGTPLVQNSTISGGSYGIYVNAGAPTISGNTISGSSAAGIKYNVASGSAAGGTLTGNTVTGGGGYAVDFALTTGGIGSMTVGQNTFSGGPFNGYGLSGNVGVDTTLAALDSPYILHTLGVDALKTLTLAPGTVVKLAAGSSLTVNGTLDARGISGGSIVLTSIKDDAYGGDTNGDGSASSPARGDWSYIRSSSGGTVLLDYGVVKFGGGSYASLYGTGGAFTVTNSTISDSANYGARVQGTSTIGTSTIRDCTESGVYVDGGSPAITGNVLTGNKNGAYVVAASPAITNNTIGPNSGFGVAWYPQAVLPQGQLTGNLIQNNTGSALYIAPPTVSGSFSGLAISGNQLSQNDYDGIQVDGTYGADVTLPVFEHPYVIKSLLTVSSGYTVAVSPGVVMKFTASGSGISSQGIFRAEGTEAAPIYFTSVKDDSVGGDTNGDGALSTPAAGDWDSLTASGSGQLVLEHVVAKYGGYAGLGLVYSNSVNAPVTLRASEVAYSRHGVYLNGTTSATVESSRIHDATYGLYVANSSTPTIKDNEIDTSQYGIYLILIQDAPGDIEGNNIHNNDYGICNMSNAGPVGPRIRYNNIYANTQYGLQDFSWSCTDARYNWWGDESGPGPTGSGDKVSSDIIFSPWTGKEYQDSRQFGHVTWSDYVKAVNVVLGNFTREVQDLAVSGKGVPIVVKRTYNSLSQSSGSFGPGWTFSYDVGLLDEPSLSRVTVTYEDGRKARFVQNPDGSYTGPPSDFSVLVKEADGSFTLTRKDHTVYHYSSGGQLQSISDRNSNTTAFSYDTNGRLSSATDAAGRSITLTRDGTGRVTSIADPAGQTTGYTYDAAGNLATFTDARGYTTTYNYNADHQLTSIVDARGKTALENQYDSQSRVATQYDALRNATTFSYDVANRATTVTDPRGAVTKYEYDADLRLSKVTDALGAYVTYSYDGNNNITQLRDKNGGVSTFTYDARGNLLSKKNPLLQESTIEYDGQDDPVRQTDPLGHVTAFTYDTHGNLLTVTDAANNVTTNTYSTDGLLASTIDPLNHVTSLQYDQYGNPSQITDPLQGLTLTSYDVLGRKLGHTDALSYATAYTYDANGNLLTETNALNGTKSNTYDEVGNLTRTVDELGRATAYTYDDKNQLVTQVDALNNSVSYTYDAQGNRISATDARGNTTAKEYDLLGRLTKVTDPLNGTTTYAYDAMGNKTAVTDPDNATTSYTYDVLNRLTSETNALNARVTYAYDAAGRRTSVTDAKNNTTTYDYDAAGRLTKVTDALNGVTLYAYDASGNRTSVTDPNGHLTSYTYDALNRQETVTDALNGVTTYRHDAVGDLTSKTDANGHLTSYTYDALNRQVSMTDAANAITGYGYDAVGNRTSVTSPRGFATSYTYDALNHLLEVKDPDLNVLETYTYDPNGNKASFTDGRSNVTTYQYDANNRLTTVTDPLLHVVSYAYDAAGRRTGVTDANGHTTTYGYDAVGHLLSVTDPLNVSTTYTYDLNGNQTGQTDGENHGTTYSYDALNRLVTVTDPLSHVTTYSYDAKGNRTGQVDRNGGTTTFTYDELDRLTQVSAPGSLSVGYTYDAVGNRLSMTDVTGTTSYTYDVVNRLERETYPGGHYLSYTYDQSGNKATATDSVTGTTSFTYDRLNHLLTVVDPAAGTTTYTYDLDGNLLTTTYPGGVNVAYTYDANNRLLTLDNRLPGGGTISSFGYTYDPSGNLATQQDSRGTTTYSYDALNRLSGITEQGGRAISFTYDHAGNRATMGDSVAGATSYTYDAANRLTTVTSAANGTKSYTYDANGNQLSDGTNGYTYDGLNRLTSVALQGGGTVSQTYDGDGLRVTRTAGGNLTRYYYNQDADVTLEADGSGSTLAANTRGAALISRLLANGQRGWYLHNGHGDVVALADGNGNVLDSYEYDAFGNQTASTGTFDNPYRYAGEPYDSETSQYYLRSRYYDPGLGRFVSEDSYGGDQNSPLTLNRYTYGLNNPLVYVDPSGHISLRLWEKKAQDQWAALGRGVADFAGDMVEGMAKMTVGLLEGAAEFAADPIGQTQQAVKSLSDGSFADKAGQMASGFWESTKEDYGRVFKDFGRVILDPDVDPAEVCQYTKSASRVAFDVITTASVVGKAAAPFLRGAKAARLVEATGSRVGLESLGEEAMSVARSSGVESSVAERASEVEKLYHYTSADPESILRNGLRPGVSGKVFTTPAGDLSPLQAQIDLALPPNRGLPQHLLEIDVQTLREMGIKIPQGQRIARMYNMPGGGIQVVFPRKIPAAALRLVR